MNKKELINTVSDNTEYAKGVVQEITESIFDTITKEMKSGEGAEVNIPGFGKFVCVRQKKRRAFNMHTRKTIKVPAQNAVRFRVSSILKKAVK